MQPRRRDVQPAAGFSDTDYLSRDVETDKKNNNNNNLMQHNTVRMLREAGFPGSSATVSHGTLHYA